MQTGSADTNRAYAVHLFSKLPMALLTGLLLVPTAAVAEPMEEPEKAPPFASEDVDELEENPKPEVVDYEVGETVDYVAKNEEEGSTWTFDPAKVELTTGESDTGTNFEGARILHGGADVIIQGEVGPGKYYEDSVRYGFWQGHTWFFGAEDPDTGNAVDAIAEFFWFESSIPRGSDFYVAHVKVKSSPNPVDWWYLSEEAGWIDNYVTWADVQPAQELEVQMEPGGAHGALRWDFCVPFETYQWEPDKVIQISEKYGAGSRSRGRRPARRSGRKRSSPKAAT